MLDAAMQLGWPCVLCWALLQASDHVLTIAAVRLHKAGARKHLVYQKGIELNPTYRAEIATGRWVTPRLVLELLVGSVVIWILWSGTIRGGDPPQWVCDLFETVFGALVMVQVPIHLRHINNLAHYAYIARSRGVRGRIEYSMGLGLRWSAIDLLAFALLFGVAFLALGRWLFAGGALNCALVAASQWREARREPLELPLPAGAEEPSHDATASPV